MEPLAMGFSLKLGELVCKLQAMGEKPQASPRHEGREPKLGTA